MESTIREIEIMSELEAIKRSVYEQRTFAIVSIKAPDGDPPVFSDNPNLVDVMRLYFYDTDQDQAGLPAATIDDFEGLKDFIDNLNCELLIVHCAAGISRSSATAAAIAEYLHIPIDVFDNPRYIPNRLVYRLVKEELGILRSQDYYDDLFGGEE